MNKNNSTVKSLRMYNEEMKNYIIADHKNINEHVLV